jgi:uncharacterized membrane protein HdeD (DUF308 family)
MTNENRQERLQTLAAGVKTGVSGKLADLWWFFILRGCIAIALGIFALFWPDKNLSILVMAVGLYCLADGAIGIVSALRQPEFRENLGTALLVLLIGAVLLFWPGATLRTLMMLLGAAIAFAGISQLLAARRLPLEEPERSSATTLASVAIAVGLVLAFWPGSGVAVMSWVIGIAALLIGALLIFLGSRLKKLGERVGEAGARLRNN